LTITFGLKPDEFDLNNIRRAFQTAEQLGFDKGCMGDHLHETIITEDRSLAEAWTTLSFLSGKLQKLRLGICVLNINWRHPVLAAKMGANLDILSNGRFEVALGLGLREPEYLAYGFSFGSPSERIKKCEEFAYLLKNLWTSDNLTFKGRYYALQNASVYPKPVQNPHPPIRVAAMGEKLITAIPKWGVGWYVQDIPDITPYREQVKWMDNACRQEGVDPKQVNRGAKLQVIIAETEKELNEKVMRCYQKSAFKLPKQLTVDDYRKSYVTGTAERVREIIVGFVKLGASDFIVSFMDPEFRENDFHSVELFSKEVIHPIKSEYN
jgi:alkanesulfonate monooxygenase SsuD/methylene tetrahydromethanopterin reductase-like flavin-dependent oxidoreductase (luciferase family)